MKLFLKTACIVFLTVNALYAQNFTHADSLRGTLSSFRSCYDVTFYDLNLKVTPSNQSISGSNTIHFTATQTFRKMQVDLFAGMEITRISQNSKQLNYFRDGDAVFINFEKPQISGKKYAIRIDYRGKPTIAKNPPWDGGFTWRKDRDNKDWVTVSCEGIGASLWWPNKDHLSDEPDSMKITCSVPKGLICVANGNLRHQKDFTETKEKKNQDTATERDFTQFEWFVSYPINNYNVSLNIADYANFKDEYIASDGSKLDLDYYVLKANLEKAQKQFQQVKPMLACYEKYFGKYPFWNDGYALVETPYWGMEHQSAVAYGNNYKNNAFGFDFIIIHESGHEYFGNSLSCNDHAEMWIHESFTTYMETLYVECLQGYEKSIEYILGQRKLMKNKVPLIGPMGVNYSNPDSDIYFKGTWMLHTIRNIVNNDKIWFEALKALTEKYKRSNVTTEQIISFLSSKTGVNLSPYFNLYLRTNIIPNVEYELIDKGSETELRYRWTGESPDFAFPIKAGYDLNSYEVIVPKKEWQSKTFKKDGAKELKIATELFLVQAQKVR